MDVSLNNYTYPAMEDLALPKEWKYSESEFLPLAGRESNDEPYGAVLNGPIMSLDHWEDNDDELSMYFDDSSNYNMNANNVETRNDTRGMMSTNSYHQQHQQQHQGVHRPAMQQKFINDSFSEKHQGVHRLAMQQNIMDMNMNDSFSNSSYSSTSSLPLEEQYMALEASMMRSQATRQCLTMDSPTTQDRVENAKQALSYISFSSAQVQKLGSLMLQ